MSSVMSTPTCLPFPVINCLGPGARATARADLAIKFRPSRMIVACAPHYTWWQRVWRIFVGSALLPENPAPMISVLGVRVIGRRELVTRGRRQDAPDVARVRREIFGTWRPVSAATFQAESVGGLLRPDIWPDIEPGEGLEVELENLSRFAVISIQCMVLGKVVDAPEDAARPSEKQGVS